MEEIPNQVPSPRPNVYVGTEDFGGFILSQGKLPPVNLDQLTISGPGELVGAERGMKTTTDAKAFPT